MPAPFVELDPERMRSSGYAQADAALHQALAEVAQQSAQELAQNNLNRLRRKVLLSLQTHWPGLTLFALLRMERAGLLVLPPPRARSSGGDDFWRRLIG